MTASDLYQCWRARRLLAVTGLLFIWGCGGHAQRQRHAHPFGFAQGRPTGGGFPVTLVDAQGASVTIVRQPARIVSLAPTVTEILFALGLGDRVVAVTEQCNYPPQVTNLPRVGGWFTPSLEKTLAARPDLVVASRGNPQQFLAALRRSGVPLFAVDPRTLDDIYVEIQDIARVTGAQQAAVRLMKGMQERLAAMAGALRDVPERDRPTAFIFLQTSPIWTAGSGTFQDDAIRAAGARNLAATKRGFAPFGVESLLAADPDFLLLSTMAGDPDRMKREVVANPVYKRLSAVKEGRMILLDADEIMRPGPRLVNAVEAMARALYPARFPVPPSSSATSRR